MFKILLRRFTNERKTEAFFLIDTCPTFLALLSPPSPGFDIAGDVAISDSVVIGCFLLREDCSSRRKRPSDVAPVGFI